MFFKTLTIQGFKSFADKTVLQFDAKTTAVVGSNGNGKSNISDALRWVMGEQGAKTLRGEKMEDVIFHGTTERKPMGFAKVTLLIDNSDRALGIDENEVEISRKLYRTGESE
ncbi:MAG: AAA family ATPase, partial [[Eubacterium] saphenum]|nr:AAA family ATPase [[Eubacterium] saphenum]